ncbi:MAG: B12-binding domain-containing protein [Candidatus Thorarchaeota archaeon]
MSNFIDEIVEMNESRVLELLKERLANNDKPLSIMEDIKAAMKNIGDKFQNKE